MASDRARISFDPTRAYRAVVAQQGRVTLEADVNEAAMIETEALRLETIDIIGPAGTPAIPAPGDGYKVLPGATPGQTKIQKGVYYLGGWRLSLDTPIELDKQPDWLDRPGGATTTKDRNDLVSLLITEQSVCAVEDQALREVALGGPDTAARLRLMQQFLLLSMSGDTCADGATVVADLLALDGVTIDPYSDQLMSSATLQVGFVPDGAPPDPCTPIAAGGYLGADNQLVRVTVSAFDQAKKTGSILWGWNNASILYRADLTDKTAGVFTLRGVPIDQEHAPQLGQAVEILRARSNLADSNFIAADSGFVTTVSQAYSFDDGTLTINDIADLPAAYLSDPGPLFIRLWQAIVPFTAGQPAPLDTTSGLEVTVNLTALPTRIAARPFWRFAVRPDTPVQVYPKRYQDGPQPPDGPRQWLCDLGVIGPAVGGAGYTLLADCRPRFTPLTDQTNGCCGLTLDPEGVAGRGGLQAVVDSLAGGPAVLSLRAGEYILPKPLVLTGHHKRLIIEGCAFSVSIRPDPANLAAFRFGLIVIEKTDAITLRRLELDVPVVPSETGGTVAGVLIGDSGLITVEDCDFGILAPHDGRIAQSPTSVKTNVGAEDVVTVFGGAIALVGRVAELTIRRNRFVGKNIFETGVVCGVIGSVNTANISTTLVGVDISDNYFERLNVAVLAYAHLGEIRCDSNRVHECWTGILFADSELGESGAFAKLALGNTQKNAALAQTVQSGFPVHLLAASAQSDAAIFSRIQPQAQAKVSAKAKNDIRKNLNSGGRAIYTEVSATQTGARSSNEPKTQSVTSAPAPASAAQAAPTETAAAQAAKAAAAQVALEATVKAHADYLSNLDHVQNVAVAAQLAGRTLNASLQINGNNITLIKAPAGHAPGVGISTILSPRVDHGVIIMTANRVVCADGRTSGAALWFPTMAAVSGNVFVHPGAAAGVFSPAVFIAFGLDTGRYAYTGNIFHSGAYIVPTRGAPAPSPDWTFFNAAN